MDRTQRFNGLEWYDYIQSEKIFIIGAGGIGSWTALFLSRIFEKPGIMVIDDDVVDRSNLGGQFYSAHDVGRLKVTALAQNINSNFGGIISTRTDRFPIENDSSPISYYTFSLANYVIVAVDNMQTRREVYDILYKQRKNGIHKVLIDGRLLAESYQIFTVQTDEDFERYQYTLFEDHEVADLACSQKATTHCSASIAADITGLVCNIATNQLYNDNVRETPFILSKHFDLMMYDNSLPDILQDKKHQCACESI